MFKNSLDYNTVRSDETAEYEKMFVYDQSPLFHDFVDQRKTFSSETELNFVLDYCREVFQE